MPRIEEILDKVGKAKSITTFGPRLGYWQVPVADEDCAQDTGAQSALVNAQDCVHQPLRSVPLLYNAIWT